MIRLHNDTVTKEEIRDWFVDKYPDSKLIVAREEEACRPHFHILLDTSTDLGKNNQNLRKLLQKHYGTGNEHYSLTSIKVGTEKRVATYCIKENNFVSVGYGVKELQVFKRMSTKKFEHAKFRDALSKIEEEFVGGLERGRSLRDYCSEYVKLKADYGQVINMNYMVQRVLMLYVKKHGSSDVGGILYDEVVKKISRM